MSDLAERIRRLPALRETIERHSLDARKGLGQHFLLDLNLTQRIARAAGDLHQGTIIEIGPGPGGLTRALLIEGAAHLVAIERDHRAVAAIGELAAESAGRLEILSADALDVDLVRLGPPPRRIVANLPYNISTALLLRWLRLGRAIDSMTLMFQKEVAERLTAMPRSKAYGRLSVLTQSLCRVRTLFDIAPRAFVPPPQVTSSVVQLEPLERAAEATPVKVLEQVTAAAFGQRRKMLRSALRPLLADPLPALEAAGIAASQRAEELDPAAFDRLCHGLIAAGWTPRKHDPNVGLDK